MLRGGVSVYSYAGASTGDTSQFGFRAIQLADFYNADQYQTLFDRYRINKVYVKIWWDHTVYDPAIGTAVDNQKTSRPILYICKDYDDSSTPTALADVLRYRNCKRYASPNVSFSFKPAVNMDVNKGHDTAYTYSPKWRQWIDLAAKDVYHYGFKWGVYLPVNMMQQCMRMQFSASVSFAGRR